MQVKTIGSGNIPAAAVSVPSCARSFGLQDEPPDPPRGRSGLHIHPKGLIPSPSAVRIGTCVTVCLAAVVLDPRVAVVLEPTRVLELGETKNPVPHLDEVTFGPKTEPITLTLSRPETRFLVVGSTTIGLQARPVVLLVGRTK